MRGGAPGMQSEVRGALALVVGRCRTCRLTLVAVLAVPLHAAIRHFSRLWSFLFSGGAVCALRSSFWWRIADGIGGCRRVRPRSLAAFGLVSSRSQRLSNYSLRNEDRVICTDRATETSN